MSGEEERVPKGYKQTEIGMFPEDWAIKTLGEIGEVTGAGVDKKANPDEKPVRLVNYIDVYNRRPITSNLLSHWVTAPANKANRCSVRKGDVFFTPTSEVREDIAVSSMALEDIPDAVYSYHLVRLRCNDEVEVAYRAHAFSAKYFLDQASVLADGSGTRYVVNLPNFRRMLVALPPRDEQRRIGTLLTDVETQIATLKDLITKKTNIKQGAMQELLTGKTRLPGFKGEWSNKKLGEIGVFSKGRGVSAKESQTGDIPCIRYGEIYTHHHEVITKFTSKISEEVAATSIRLKSGDILFAGSGETREDIGKCVAFIDDFQAYAGGDVVILRPKDMHSEFLGFYLNSEAIRNQKANLGQGDAVVHIYSHQLSSIAIRIPEINEQQAIAEVLSDMDAEITALEQRLEKTKAIKQGIVQELLTGKTRMLAPDST